MTPSDSNHILEMARAWYQSEIINSQIRKVQALSINSFNINPFTAPYLSSFLTGAISADGIARALVYARVLGTSLATTFGTNLQSFISSVLSNADGSVVEGIDIEFIDKIDAAKNTPNLKQLQIPLILVMLTQFITTSAKYVIWREQINLNLAPTI
jgi:hypothetical protein